MRRFYLITLLVIFGLLSILGAKKHPLWPDEAYTGVFARNVMNFGYPTAWDGQNIAAYRNGKVLNTQLIDSVTPWLQYYVTAASFKLFGISTFSARLPFIIASLITVWISYRLASSGSQKLHYRFVSLLLMCTSVPFILFSYQARYYALASLLTTFFVYRILISRPASFANLFFTTVVAIALFYSSPLACVSLLLALVLPMYFFKINQLKQFILILAFVGIASIPWFLVFRGDAASAQESFINFNLVNGSDLFFRYIKDINDLNILPWLLVFGFMYEPIRSKFFKSKNLMFLTLTCVMYLIFLSLLSPQQLQITAYSDIRYAMNIVPFLLLIVAGLLTYSWQVHRLAGTFMLLILTFTNFFSLRPPFRIWLYDFLHEVTDRSYISPVAVAVDFFYKNAQAGDYVFVSPDYYADSLIFYLDDQIRVINRLLTGNERLIRPNKHRLPPYVYQYNDQPQWLIFFSKRLQFDSRALPAQTDLSKYEEIKIPIFAHDLTRPEIFMHSFYPVKPESDTDYIYIYRRKT